MKLPSKQTQLPALPARVLVTAALVLCAAVSNSGAQESAPPTTKPRPTDIKPRLAFSPSTVESCVTSVVTLECSPKGGRTLQARIAAPEDDAVEDTNLSDNQNTAISSIIIFKQNETGGTESNDWSILAEIGDSASPSGSALADPKVKVTGKVGVSAEQSYLRVIWDMASDDTFGVYRCDVMTVGGSNPVSSEPVTLNPSSNDGTEDKLLNALQDLQTERQKEEDWRGNVNDGLEQIRETIKLLEIFARGNAFKLNKIIKELTDLQEKSATTSQPTAAETTTGTTSATQRTFASPTGGSDVTKKFVLLGIAGGKPTATLPPTTPTSKRGKGKGGGNKRRKNKKNRRRGKGRRVGRDTRKSPR